MDTYTSLNSSAPLSPISNRIWKIKKKHKTEDHHRRHRESNRRQNEENVEHDTGEEYGRDIGKGENGADEQELYGSVTQKKMKNKIDLII